MTGVATANLIFSNIIDSILGNYAGNTRIITVERLASLIAALMGPTHATRAQLYADLDWPANAVGYVRGDSNPAFNGVYRKNGGSGGGSWTRIGDLPTGAIETAIIDNLQSEVRNRRVASIWVSNFTAASFPPGTDTVLQRTNSAISVWTATSSAPSPVDPAIHQQDADGGWWIRAWSSAADAATMTALETEIRNGRVWQTSNGNLTNQTPPDGTAQISVAANAGLTVWRRLGSAPDPIDPSLHAQTADGVWWRRSVDTGAITTALRAGASLLLENVTGTGDAITADMPAALISAGITSPGPGVSVIYVPVSTNANDDPTLSVGGGTYGVRTADLTRWHAGRFVVGRAYLMQRIGSYWRVMSGDVTGNDVTSAVGVERSSREAAILAEEHARSEAVAAVVSKARPGDGAVVVADAADQALLVTLVNGMTRGRFSIADIVDVIKSPTRPGDHVAVLIEDAAGGIVLGFDQRSGDPVGVFAGGGGGETPGTVAILPPEAAMAVGDAWAVMEGPDGEIVYQSNQWDSHPIGYEMRSGKSIAVTKAITTGVVAFGGGGLSVSRDLPESYPYHLFGPDLGAVQLTGAAASGAATLDLLGAARRARPTTLAISRYVASTTEADALPGSGPRADLNAALDQAVESLEPWGKTLFVDRIHLSLLEGAPGTGELTADSHYAAIANALRADVVAATGQAGLPMVLVSQSAGTRTDGTSPVILAEGRLDWRHFALGMVVTTPRYPFALQPGMPGTHTAEGYTLISEIEAHAVWTIQNGGEWYCPSLEDATVSGAVIVARFATLSDLVLQDAAVHGFSLAGNVNGAGILEVAVSGSHATITLDRTLDRSWGFDSSEPVIDNLDIAGRAQQELNILTGSGRRSIAFPATFPPGTRIRFTANITGSSGAMFPVLDDEPELLTPREAITSSQGLSSGTHEVDYICPEASRNMRYFGFVANGDVAFEITDLIVDLPSDHQITLQYAFGQTGDPGDGYAANRGSLTDNWSRSSRYVSAATLHRYARSGRVTLTA